MASEPAVERAASSSEPEHHRVLIIGGGVAGLSAASCLVKNGITDFRILEARGRLGGRLVAITIDQLKLQLGAMWIHGVLGNPIYELAVRSGLISSVQEQPPHALMACREDGTCIPFHIVEEVYEAYDLFVGRCCEYFLCKFDPPPGITSVGDHLRLEIDLYLASLPERERQVRRNLFEHLLSREAVISGSHNMEEVDLVSFGAYCDLPGGNIMLPDGYSSILGPLKKDIPPEAILVGHPVSRICWNQPDCAHVTAHCENGRVFTADHVVCTIPLGVLQQKPNLWEPELPKKRADAIRRLGFGNCNKIFLEYERPFLASNFREMLLAWEPADETLPMADRWQRKIHSFEKMTETLLLAWVTGEEADYIETISYEEVGRVCTEVLAKFLGDPCVPRPKRTICSGWRGQPFTRGAYTFVKTGSTGSDMFTMSAPLCAPGDSKPRVLFAGEHCHPSFYSTVHGAYLSGKSVVEEIVAAPSGDQQTVIEAEEENYDLSAWVAGIGLS